MVPRFDCFVLTPPPQFPLTRERTKEQPHAYFRYVEDDVTLDFWIGLAIGMFVPARSMIGQKPGGLMVFFLLMGNWAGDLYIELPIPLFFWIFKSQKRNFKKIIQRFPRCLVNPKALSRLRILAPKILQAGTSRTSLHSHPLPIWRLTYKQRLFRHNVCPCHR